MGTERAWMPATRKTDVKRLRASCIVLILGLDREGCKSCKKGSR